jgi:hypothetical protein
MSLILKSIGTRPFHRTITRGSLEALQCPHQSGNLVKNRELGTTIKETNYIYIYIYIYITIIVRNLLNIQGDSGEKVYILGGASIGYCEKENFI